MFNINKKQLKISIALILFVFAIFSIINHVFNTEYINTLSNNSMLAFTDFTFILGDKSKDIEIFDIDKGEIIKSLPANQIIQDEAIEYLKGITGMYPKVNALPSKGYIVRIYLEPSVFIKNQWINEALNEIYIVFPPKNDKPYLLILDNKSRPVFFIFDANTDTLLKNIDLKL